MLGKYNKYARKFFSYQDVCSFDTIEEAANFISKQKESDKQWEYHYCCQWRE